MYRLPSKARPARGARLQNVPLARRFALVPLGPPSLRYSSISKAMIKHDEASSEVVLLADRTYKKGVPNSRFAAALCLTIALPLSIVRVHRDRISAGWPLACGEGQAQRRRRGAQRAASLRGAASDSCHTAGAACRGPRHRVVRPAAQPQAAAQLRHRRREQPLRQAHRHRHRTHCRPPLPGQAAAARDRQCAPLRLPRHPASRGAAYAYAHCASVVCSGSEFMLKVDTAPFAPVATRMRVRRAASVLSTVCVRWRMLARCADMATKFDFQLQRNKGLPEQLIPFLRICYCEDEAALKGIDVKSAGDITEADVPILQHLALFLQQRLARCALPASQRGALLVPRLPGASARESRREQGLTDDPRGCRHPRSMPC